MRKYRFLSFQRHHTLNLFTDNPTEQQIPSELFVPRDSSASGYQNTRHGVIVAVSPRFTPAFRSYSVSPHKAKRPSNPRPSGISCALMWSATLPQLSPWRKKGRSLLLEIKLQRDADRALRYIVKARLSRWRSVKPSNTTCRFNFHFGNSADSFSRNRKRGVKLHRQTGAILRKSGYVPQTYCCCSLPTGCTNSQSAFSG